MAEELTLVDVDEMLETIAEHEALIKTAEEERDLLIARYQSKIAAAEKICENKCKPHNTEIALLTEQLRQYAAEHVTGRKRSLQYPSGTLSFRKQPPRFFTDDMQIVSGKNESLLEFVKAKAPEYLKTNEYVDWFGLRNKLVIDGDNVFFADTGEVIDGLHAQIPPDTFTVQTN